MKQFTLGLVCGIIACFLLLLSINPESYPGIVFMLTDNKQIAETVENLIIITYGDSWFVTRILSIILMIIGIIIYFFVLGRTVTKNIKD